MSNHRAFYIPLQLRRHVNSLAWCFSPYLPSPFLIYTGHLDNRGHPMLQRSNEPSGENETNEPDTRMEDPDDNYPVPVFVRGLDKTVNDEEFYEFLVEADTTPVSVKICRDKHTMDSLGYGYVNFPDHEDAAKALEKLNLTIYNGNLIKLTWSIRDVEARKSCVGKLFLKNLAPSIGEARLYGIFSEVGKVLYVGVARKSDRSSLGHGYVQFESQELADFAIRVFNNTIVDGEKMLVGQYVNKN